MEEPELKDGQGPVEPESVDDASVTAEIDLSGIDVHPDSDSVDAHLSDGADPGGFMPAATIPTDDEVSPKRKVNVKVLGIVAACLVVAICAIGVFSAMSTQSGSLNETASNWATTSNSDVQGPTNPDRQSPSEKAKSDEKVAGAASVQSDVNSDSTSDAMSMSSDTTVKEGDVLLVTKSYDATFSSISQAIENAGAKVIYRRDSRGGNWMYTSSGRYEKSGSARQLDLTLKVPNDGVYKFLDAVTLLDGVEVEALEVDARDVSEDIKNVEDRKTETEAEIAKLQEQLASDSLSASEKNSVQQKLNKAEAKLKDIVETANEISSDVESSEIRLRLREQVEPVGTDALSKALSGSLSSFASVMSFVLAFLVWLAPYVVLIAVVCGIVILVRSRIKSKDKAGDEVGEKQE